MDFNIDAGVGIAEAEYGEVINSPDQRRSGLLLLLTKVVQGQFFTPFPRSLHPSFPTSIRLQPRMDMTCHLLSIEHNSPATLNLTLADSGSAIPSCRSGA